jgi:hypothetical protein
MEQLPRHPATYSKMKAPIAIFGSLKGLNQHSVLVQLAFPDCLICKVSATGRDCRDEVREPRNTGPGQCCEIV